jgi:hypoxanthine phosphoribosyltransferase
LKPGRVLVDEKSIATRLAAMGSQITADYQGKDLLLVAVLKGAFMTMADLVRHIRLPVDIDFMAVSSYGAATETSGVVRILKDLEQEIAGRHVLIVEDIIDSGLTTSGATSRFASLHPSRSPRCFSRRGFSGSRSMSGMSASRSPPTSSSGTASTWWARCAISRTWR